MSPRQDILQAGQSPNPADLQFLVMAHALGPLLAQLNSGQAQDDQDLQQLHGQAQAAQGQSDQAFQDYSQAAQAPPQQLPPGANFFNQMGGDVASILTQNPTYGKRATDQHQQMHDDLAKQRLASLSALKDNYDRLASAAERLGNTEAAAQYRAKHDQALQKSQVLVQGLKESAQQKFSDQQFANQKELERLRQGGRVDLLNREIKAGRYAKTGGAPVEEANLDDYTDQTTTGHKYIDLSTVPDKKVQQALSTAAHKQGIPVMKDASPIKTLESVRENLDDLERYAGKLEPENALTKPFVSIKNAIGAKTELSPDAASFITTRQNVINLMQGLAAAGKGNRIMQQEIKIGLNTLPTMFNTKDTGGQKIAKTRKAIDNIERALIGGRGPRVPSLSTGGNAKTQVLAAIRKGDIDQVNSLLDRNPELEKDQNINDLVDEMLNAEPAK